MLISFECEQCGRRYKVDESKVGQSATCRDCSGEIRVPVPGPETETTPAGTAVYRHQARERDFEPAVAGDSLANWSLATGHWSLVTGCVVAGDSRMVKV